MTDGPFKFAFNADTIGVIRREIITYRMRDDGRIFKEEAVRDYYQSVPFLKSPQHNRLFLQPTLEFQDPYSNVQ